MDSPLPNRIAHLVDDATATPVTRTPAQQEAARLNGAKSCGPKTSEGKLISRGNALKHGILAAVITPPQDFRGLDLLYRQIRRRLIAEFTPATFSGQATVDALAHDFVRLARAKRVLEASQRPRDLPPEDEERRLQLVAARRDLALFRSALAAWAAHEPWEFPLPQASRIASRLMAMLAGVEQDLAEADDPDLEPMDPIDVELRIPQTRMIKALGASRKRFNDRALLMGALTGERPLGKVANRRLRALLVFAAESTRSYLEQNKTTWTHLQRLADNDAARGATVENLPLLLKLERYQGQIERAIDRKIRRLQGK